MSKPMNLEDLPDGEFKKMMEKTFEEIIESQIKKESTTIHFIDEDREEFVRRKANELNNENI